MILQTAAWNVCVCVCVCVYVRVCVCARASAWVCVMPPSWRRPPVTVSPWRTDRLCASLYCLGPRQNTREREWERERVRERERDVVCKYDESCVPSPHCVCDRQMETQCHIIEFHSFFCFAQSSRKLLVSWRWRNDVKAKIPGSYFSRLWRLTIIGSDRRCAGKRLSVWSQTRLCNL